MASYYVRSGAGGSADGSSWANAYTTLAGAFSGKSAGDIFLLANDHAETQSSAMTLTSPGTAIAPCYVLCVNTHATEPPTGLATTATITTTGAVPISIAGFAYVYGVDFVVGSGVASSAQFLFVASTATGWKIDNGKITIATTSTAGRIAIGNAISTTSKDCLLHLVNTSVKFSNTSQGFAGAAGALGKLIWEGSSSSVDATGSIPTSLFIMGTAPTMIDVRGVDLSALGSGKNLVAVGTNTNGRVNFSKCKLGASVSVMTGTIPSQGGTEVYLDTSDSGDTNYRMERYFYQGSTLAETTIKMTGRRSI